MSSNLLSTTHICYYVSETLNSHATRIYVFLLEPSPIKVVNLNLVILKLGVKTMGVGDRMWMIRADDRTKEQKDPCPRRSIFES